jgi:hypothetical protein
VITAAPSRSPDFLKILKEGAIVAGVVFALAFGLVGFRTEDVPGGLDIRYRFDDVVMASVIAFSAASVSCCCARGARCR